MIQAASCAVIQPRTSCLRFPDRRYGPRRCGHSTHHDAASKRRRSDGRGALSRARWVGTDLLREYAELGMTGQRCQAPFDEGGRGLQFSALPCEAGLEEHEFWPRQCRIRDKPVEKLLMVRPGQTPHQEGVPLAQVLGPLLSTPTAALLITAALGNPVQSIQVVASNLGPKVGHDQELGEHTGKGVLACASPSRSPVESSRSGTPTSAGARPRTR